MESKIPDGTIKLLDDEAVAVREHQVKIGKIALEIEEIFLREDVTMGDLLEVFGLFTSRANSVFENIKIKQIKKDYGKI